MHELTVCIPTLNRITELAVTLAGLSSQTFPHFTVVISDQSDGFVTSTDGVVQTMARALILQERQVEFHSHLPRQGMAEQRQFLLDRAKTPYVLFLDDDIFLEPWVLDMLLRVIKHEKIGYVGNAVMGLQFLDDVREDEQNIEFWSEPVQPEKVEPNSLQWERYKLHNAANLLHVEKKHECTPQSPGLYKVAWIGGCTLFDREKLLDAGGYAFWQNAPHTHSGEDVLAQLRVMEKYGGAGVLPTGAYHLDVPTTLPDRSFNLPEALPNI